jgi:hypothetical protein
VTQTYLSPQATIDPLTSRVASAAGRLGSNGVAGSENARLFVCCRLYGSYPKTAFEEVIKSNRRGTWTIDALTGDADFKLPVMQPLPEK